MTRGKPYILAAVLLLAVPILAQNSAQQNHDKNQAGVAGNAASDPASDATGNAAEYAAGVTAAPGTEPEAIPALPASEYKNAPASEEERITRKVRHLLVMQPAYSIWDWLAYRVNGNTVELLGDVYSGGLKHDAIDAVREIEGVGRVIDHMHLLSPSPVDDRIRHEVANAIYSGVRCRATPGRRCPAFTLSSAAARCGWRAWWTTSRTRTRRRCAPRKFQASSR